MYIMYMYMYCAIHVHKVLLTIVLDLVTGQSPEWEGTLLSELGK